MNQKMFIKRLFLMSTVLMSLICLNSHLLSDSQEGQGSPQEQMRIPEISTPKTENMIDVGGRKLDCCVYGSGSPTVVLVSGLDIPQAYWDSVIPDLAAKTTVLTYDRAGVGKSEIGGLPTHGEQSAKDLQVLLDKLGVPRPYILIGHSYGGSVARLFASMDPDDMGGLILEDTQHEDVLNELRKILKGKDLEAFEQVVVPGFQAPEVPKTEADYRNLTRELVRRSKPLPRIPFIVLSSPDRAKAMADLFSAEAVERIAKLDAALNEKLAALIPGGKQIVVEGAGHHIHVDKPGALIAPVMEMIKTVREKGTQVLGLLPAGMSPDSVDFTASELYVLDRGTVSVFSLPDIVRLRTFGGSGNGPGQLAPRHSFDQALRVIEDRVLAEDNDKIVVFSTAGQLREEKRKPENTAWFVPVGDRFAAKSMVVSGEPPTQYMRLVLYDSQLREIKELYRQAWFQQQDPPGFSTMLLGDLLHFAVVRDNICVEESPKGFVIELFDAVGNKVSTIEKSLAGMPVTPQDRDREMSLVRKEKRVAAMIARAGSWEKLRQIWKISFPETTPALREIQACGNNLLVRTFERRENREKYLLLDLDGTIRRELFLPVVSDAETEARVSGTAFFKLIGERFYYLRQNEDSDRWEVRLSMLPEFRAKN